MSESAPLRVLVAGGGTAGHVNPLLALADELRRRDERSRILVLGTEAGIEARLVPERGYRLATIPRAPFPRRPDGDLVRFVPRLRTAIRRSRHSIDELGAEVVVGFGGYVAAPAYLAARRAGVPIVVHEQNAKPGMANRWGARKAAAVAVTFEATALRAPSGLTEVTGLPLRPAIQALADARAEPAGARAARLAGADALGLDPQRRTVVVTGGSLGALSLNTAIAASAPDLLATGAQVLHLTGAGKSGPVREALAGLGPEASARYHVLEYLDRMEHALACADVVFARSGAGTVCELAALGVPAVYVPLPIGNGEQRLNAEPIVAAGGGLVVSDDQFTAAWVAGQGVALVSDPERLSAMGAAALAAGRRDGASRLADLVEVVARRRA